MRKLIGVALVVIGAVLLFWGYDFHQMPIQQGIEQRSGGWSEAVWQYYMTGAIALGMGLYTVLRH
ncbi:hypothetical protein BFW38_08545 [Terasakiispira papahanaumokuakeensis]|uniref:DUF3185 domain-containing protein n=1 Tax=Terasakiispira papahanaumokuakeensis TaxID=197479 RepID=A0A1E2VAA9_9GAMM|nr:DUF3185 family protein [Terasakiispira papahanaumokuakeensis]ODC03585.1 hypothetical protein BFW38_08545 [Terasakiispira papahanaumokuakeensis]